MALTLPEGPYGVAEDAGHAVIVDQTEQFDRLLKVFLSRNVARQRTKDLA
jgi:hypothetical protein